MTETTIAIANGGSMSPFRRGDPITVGGGTSVWLVADVPSVHTLTVVPNRWYWRLWIGLTIDWQRFTAWLRATKEGE